MRKFKFGIPLLGACALAFGLSGCADESHWGNTSNEKGSIRLTLSTDTGIKTSKPVFRSEDGAESASDPNDLTTYIKVPSPEEFSIRLEKNDETFSKTWTTLNGFLNYTKDNLFPTGEYTLTAYYGEKGRQDFNAPYFEAAATFNVLSDDVQELNLEAELKNSLVRINYTDAFKAYMSEYHSRIRPYGSNEIYYAHEEKSPLFLEYLIEEEKQAALTVHITTKEKNHTTDIHVGEFSPQAKTLHDITLDLIEMDNGKATLDISFSDDLEEESIKIDLTDELFTAEAPVINCIGFNSGETIEVLEYASSPTDIKMQVFAEGLVESAILTIQSETTPSWGESIDLCKATQQQKADILAAGISPIGFGFNSEITEPVSELILTDYCKNLKKGIYKISLNVTDKNKRESNQALVILDGKPVELDVVGTPTISYNGKNTEVTLDYNGINPLSDLTFKMLSDQDILVNVPVTAYQEETATRGFDKKRYIYSLELPNSVTAIKDMMELEIYHGKSNKPTLCKINVVLPKYDLVYDAFSDYAYIKVNLQDNNDPELPNIIFNNIKFKIDGKDFEATRYEDQKYFKVTGLIPNKEHAISSAITKGDASTWTKHNSINTEAAKEIEQGDFSQPGGNIAMDLDEGGKYKVKVAFFTNDYQLKSSFSRDLPGGNWATINDKTAWKGSSNKNTWFIVPSTWVENEECLIRTVGYNHNGTTPETSGGSMNQNYYCENSPTPDQLDVAAGELFLGTYSFDGSEHRVDGIGFNSRPSSISFDYKYTPIESGDQGKAIVKILDSQNNILSVDSIYLSDTENLQKKAILDLPYIPFGNQANKLILSFRSSKLNNPPIHIPTGTELQESSITTVNFTNPPAIEENKYKAVATGSELLIDNVTANYGNPASANAPKRTTKKKK